MAIVAPASLTKIHTEFGGSGPFSDYIRGGAYVPDGPTENASISTTVNGLALSQFTGAIGADVDPDTFNFGNISGTNTATTTTETISGHTGIDLYHTQTYNTGSIASVEYSINSGTWTIWSPGSGNTIAIANNDTLAIRVSTAFSSVDVDINIYNASNGNAFEDGFNANVTHS